MSGAGVGGGFVEVFSPLGALDVDCDEASGEVVAEEAEESVVACDSDEVCDCDEVEVSVGVCV